MAINYEEKYHHHFYWVAVQSQKWSNVLGRPITPGAFKPGTFADKNVIRF
jgi:hypothetical protein